MKGHLIAAMTSLDKLFRPASLAIVGASKDPRKSGHDFLARIRDAGYSGDLYPVNPREKEILGLTCYPSLAEVPGDIDLAYVAVPAPRVLAVIDDCAARGVKFAVVHTAGFAELGPDGRKLQEEIVAVARRGRVRIIGPNCMGIYSPAAGINTITDAPVGPDAAGSVAFVGQSGWATENVMVMSCERGLRFSKAVSIGNQADLTHEDMLRHFAGDGETGAIGFYAEGFRRGDQFLSLAAEVARTIPVVVWESGRTETGARVTMSHTGSAGDDLITTEALAASGVTVADNLEEMVDFLTGFASPVLPAGNRLAMLVEAGGVAAAGADAAGALGFHLPVFSEAVQDELAAVFEGVLPPFSRPRNPVDTVWTPVDAPADFYRRSCQAMLREVDSLLLASYREYDDDFLLMLTGLRDETGKPIVVVPCHPTESRDGMARLVQRGIPSFASPERAVAALAAMLAASRYRLRGSTATG